MQYTKILKFRYNDLPQEFLCKICKTVCLNPRQQELHINELRQCIPIDCEQVDTFYSIEFRNQIQQFIQIQCEYCGEYQKYFHYRIHSNLCQLIFQKSQFLLYFKQINFENLDIRCYICSQIPYRPQENNDKKLICLFCIKGRDFQNINQLKLGEQTLIDQIVLQCSQFNCQKHVKLDKVLKHYKKCQMKNSELIIKLSYDLAKTKLVINQILQKIETQEKIINLIHDDK
ncbi:hypothetical protein pb186bvf_011206 [Paramecium bursaria]